MIARVLIVRTASARREGPRPEPPSLGCMLRIVDAPKAGSERVAEGVRAEAAGYPDPPLEPADHVLEAAGADLALPSEEQGIIGLSTATLTEVPDGRLPSRRADRHDPLLRALAANLDRPIGSQGAEPKAGHLRHVQAGIEHEQHDRSIANRGDRKQPPKDVVGDGLNDLVRHPRPAEPAQRGRLGQALRAASQLPSTRSVRT